jgi:hypothetical protein
LHGKRENECRRKRKKEMNHPYCKYEAGLAWKIVDEAIADLVANQDIRETTPRQYIVGYLVKALVEGGVINPEKMEGA